MPIISSSEIQPRADIPIGKTMELCVLMHLGVVAISVAFLVAGTAHASSIVTIDEGEQPSSPSIIEVAAPPIISAAVERVAMPSENGLELAALDPLNMLPAGGNSVVRMQPLTPSVVAVVAPDSYISNEIVAAIDHRKPRHDPLPMVMRGGIAGDPFQPQIELGKTSEKLPEKADDKQPAQAESRIDPEAISKPQFTETGAPMPANGTVAAGGKPRHSALR